MLDLPHELLAGLDANVIVGNPASWAVPHVAGAMGALVHEVGHLGGVVAAVRPLPTLVVAHLALRTRPVARVLILLLANQQAGAIAAHASNATELVLAARGRLSRARL